MDGALPFGLKFYGSGTCLDVGSMVYRCEEGDPLSGRLLLGAARFRGVGEVSEDSTRNMFRVWGTTR